MIRGIFHAGGGLIGVHRGPARFVGIRGLDESESGTHEYLVLKNSIRSSRLITSGHCGCSRIGVTTKGAVE
jgi:hypothetical protein